MGNFVVVGSSSGIGKSLSAKLEAEGHSVIGISRTNGNALANHYALDVTDSSSPLPLLTFPIDGIAYCVGSITLKPFRNLKEQDFLHEYQLNVLGAVRILQHFLPLLTQSPQASVVLFSSVAAQTGMPFHSTIGTAKSAVEGLTRALAAELAPKIRVNCVAPSLTDTPLASRLLDTEQKRTSAKERHPLKEIASPSDIADFAYHLLTPASKFITGQIIKIDGGLSSLRA